MLTNPILTESTNEGGGGEWGRKSSTNIQSGAQNKLLNLAQLECTTHAIEQTLFVASWRMVP